MSLTSGSEPGLIWKMLARRSSRLTFLWYVSTYEDDALSGIPNNVIGIRPEWNTKERGDLVAYPWDDFLRANGDPAYPNLANIYGAKMFPRPDGYIPDKYIEIKNIIKYPGLNEFARNRNGKVV